MDKGDLVPDDVTIRMMEARLLDPKVKECGFILDGFPRTVPQAEALDELLAKMGLSLERVIALDIDDEDVLARLSGRRTCPNCGEIFHIKSRPPKSENVCDKCGTELIIRPDDQPDTIRERLEVFHRNTEPVEKYYEDKGMLHHVDGELTPDQVFQSILDALSG